MKPYKTFLILLVFMVFLYGPSLFHADRIHYGKSSSIRLPQYSQLTGDELDLNLLRRDTLLIDSVPSKDADSSIVSMPPELTGIEFNDSSDFYPSLIDSLIKDGPQTRILYYGDSQMEGDRITDFLRKELRMGRGGTGPGLISPTMLVPYTRTAYVRTSPNWERYTYRSVLDGDVEHADLGPLLSVSRYNTDNSDSTDAWIRITPSNSADPESRNY